MVKTLNIKKKGDKSTSIEQYLEKDQTILGRYDRLTQIIW